MKEETNVYLSRGAVGADGKQSSAFYLLGTGFSLDFLFFPEDGGDIFIRNVNLFSEDYIALCPRK
jgi:hypothetical protein